MRAWRWFAPRQGATPAQNNCGSQGRQKNSGVWAGVADCGTSWKWGYKGSSRLQFKLKVGLQEGGEAMHDYVGGQCETMWEEKE